MAAVETTVGIVFALFVNFNNGENLPSTVVFSPSELIRDSNLVNNSLKLALRYGFQQTAQCRDFAKAFVCVQKCLSLGFDIAQSNRNCFCTCFHKAGKAKKTSPTLVPQIKFGFGAPTTKLPAWVQKLEEKTKHNKTVDIHYDLVEGNMSDVTTDQTENPTGETETGVTEDNANTTDVTGKSNTDKDADNATDATGAPKNESIHTGATGSPKDAVTGTGKKDAVTGTGKNDAGTGTGNADAGTKVAGNSTGGTNGPGPNTGGTGNAPTGTKANDAPTGGTGKPKAETGAATTVA